MLWDHPDFVADKPTEVASEGIAAAACECHVPCQRPGAVCHPAGPCSSWCGSQRMTARQGGHSACGRLTGGHSQGGTRQEALCPPPIPAALPRARRVLPTQRGDCLAMSGNLQKEQLPRMAIILCERLPGKPL